MATDTPKEARKALEVEEAEAGMRLDKFLCQRLAPLSRNAARQLIESGQVSLEHSDDSGSVAAPGRSDEKAAPEPLSPAMRLRPGQAIAALLPESAPAQEPEAEDIPLKTAWLDEEVIVVNKPAGLVVHPGAGNPRHTMLNALLHAWPGQAELARAGIVHRLDRDTSGLLLVARSSKAQASLKRALKARKVTRRYIAIVHGNPIAGGTIEAPLGRHPGRRTQIGVSEEGREAVTHFRVLKRFDGVSVISVHLETGRTHQIRVHMRHIGHPVVGDPVYGRRGALPSRIPEQIANELRGCRRQMLHSWAIKFNHPANGKEISLSSPLPPDMRSLLLALARHGRRI